LGFKESCRSTNYAIQAIVENVAWTAIQLGIESIEIRIKGLGYGKESFLHGLWLGDFIITIIQDVGLMPHNGCWLPKNVVFKYDHKVIHFNYLTIHANNYSYNILPLHMEIYKHFAFLIIALVFAWV